MGNKRGQGRKPKPTHLKILDGEVNKRRINLDEPKPYPKAPACPSWLSSEARREWKRLAPRLEKLGILTENDLAAFAAYCSAFGKLAWAEREIKKGRVLELRQIKADGLKEKDVLTSGGMIGGKSKNSTLPPMWIYNKALEHIRSFGAEFGLSPSSRTRIKVADSDGSEDDLFTK